MLQRIIGVNSNTYHGFSIEDALYGIAAAGFSYVELTATKGWTEHVFPSHSFAESVKIKKLMEKLKLTPFALSGHCNLMDPQRLNDFRMNMELAAFYGCSFIVSSAGEAHIADKIEDDNEILVKNLTSLLPDLEKYNMQLVLETHGNHGTGAKLTDIVNKVHSPLIGINYDTANVVFYGNVLPEKDLFQCIDKIKFLHLKDKAGRANEWNFPALGQGYINFPEIFKLLDSAKNTAPFSIEIEFTQNGPSSLEEVNKAVKDSYEYLRSKGFQIGN